MKSLKERLEQKIRKESLKHSAEFVNASVLAKANSSIAYESGAESLVPLVVELANELQLTAIQKTKDEYESDEDNDIWDFVCASEAYEITIMRSRKALQLIEKFLGEK